MSSGAALRARDIWDEATPTSQRGIHCTPFTLPSAGVISLAGSAITLTENVVFQPECTGTYPPEDVSTIADLKDPFYASTIPQTYVISAATVIAWILVIMLIITPRTSFLGQSSAGPGFGNGRGLIGGATGGGTSLIGVGSRPWLQKVAALTVAASLTIATADTFKAAREQYYLGYMDADALREDVLNSLEIRISRIISDIFLWLAQVQTLIRLFPRHREKVLIKWIGFALILLDTLFSCLNSFMIENTHQPKNFIDAIPALAYLFELALSLLYAAWVIYYSLTKRRYAFFHHKMRSVSLIAILSVVAVLTPVVFFITDVSNRDVAGWGDYFRWVGAAAASVVVWEWVERIEALERDEKKDGILGREIFDGDEMLESSPGNDFVWTPSRGVTRHFRRNGGDGGDGDGGDGGHTSSAVEQGLSHLAERFRPRRRKPREHFPLGRAHSNTTNVTAGQPTNESGGLTFSLPRPRRTRHETMVGGPTPPPAIASPVSRNDNTSAASTTYVIHYHPTVEAPIRRGVDASGNTRHAIEQAEAQRQTSRRQSTGGGPEKEEYEAEEAPQPPRRRNQDAWYSVANPFKRKRASPPAEVQQAHRAAAANERTTTPSSNFSRLGFGLRRGSSAAKATERPPVRPKPDTEPPLTVIPAHSRNSNRVWGPSDRTDTQTRPAPSPNPLSYPVSDPLDPLDTTNTIDTTHTSDVSPPHHSSGATTLTANSNPCPASPARTRDSTFTTTTSRRPNLATQPSPSPASPTTHAHFTPPPRANDISPASGNSSGAPTIIPAPRRDRGRGSVVETAGLREGEEEEAGGASGGGGVRWRDEG